MNKSELEQINALRKELKALKRQIMKRSGKEKLQSDVVKGSLPEFPYTEVHYKVEGIADPLREKLRAKAYDVETKIAELEYYIDMIPDAEMRAIIRYRYSLGLTLEEIGIELGYDKSAIKRKIDRFMEEQDETNSI